MAFYINFAERLQATRAWLSDVMQINNPRNYQKQTGMLNYLFSGIHPNVIEVLSQTQARNGTYRAVDIRYVPHKGTSNLVTSDASASCDRVNQRRDYISTYQPTLFAMDKFTIDENYVRENAENGYKLQQRLNDEFLDAMRVCRESLNAQLLAQAATKIGANPAQGAGAGAYTTIDAIIASSGKIDDRNWDVIVNDMEDNFQVGTPAIIGLGNARRYMNRLAVGNINDNGIDYRAVAAEYGAILFKDHDAAAQLGNADNTLVIYPGAAQFYSYQLNAGADFILDDEKHIKGTMPDPVYPITWDFILKYDDECDTGNGLQGAWTGRVFLNFDLFTVPEDAYGDVYGDLNDFTGIVGYKITEA